jgi:hypothetical protein
MINRTKIPYEKVALIPAVLKMPLGHVPKDAVQTALDFCVQRAGGLPAGLQHDPPVFTNHEQGHALRVRFHAQAEAYVDAASNNRVLACSSTTYDGFCTFLAQQSSGMVVG